MHGLRARPRIPPAQGLGIPDGERHRSVNRPVSRGGGHSHGAPPTHISTNGAPPTHLIQGAQPRDVGSACQGHLLHVHGLIPPHGLLHSDLHCPELLWGQWGLRGCGENRPTGSQPCAWERCMKKQSVFTELAPNWYTTVSSA